jgi:hypothetical protein
VGVGVPLETMETMVVEVVVPQVGEVMARMVVLVHRMVLTHKII